MDIKQKSALILTMLFLASAISDFVWLSKETVPPGWDESLHLTKSLQYYDVIMSSQLDKLNQIDDYYPPLYHMATFIPYVLFGTSTNSAIFVNIIFFSILLFSVYGIGKHFGGEQAGLIAALLVTLYPGVLGIRRFFVIDNGIISLVALSIYMLILSDNFKNSKFTIYFGIVSALAVLSKWTAVFFIIPPLLVVYYEGFWKEKRRPLMSFYGMIVIGILLSLTWYWEHFWDVYNKISWGNVYWGTIEGDPNVFSVESFLFYGKALINSQISFLFFIVALVGIIKYRKNLFLISIIVLPYIVMTLMKNKNERYTMPSLVAIAVLSGLWIASVKTKQTRAVILSVILILGSAQLIMLGMNSDAKALNIVGVDITSPQIYGTRPSMTEDWKTNELVNVIGNDLKRDARIKGRPANVGVVVDFPYLNGLTIGYYAYEKKLPIQSISVTDFEATQPFIDNFYRFDYLILKSDKYHMTGRKQIMVEMNEYFYNHTTGWTPIGTFNLPDQTNAIVYKNTIVTLK